MKRWGDCERCDRHRGRLGVYAPSWPAGVEVVVFGTHAPWSGQAAAHDEAGVDRLVCALRESLHLAETECVGDALVACGAGDIVLPDEVAGCTTRLIENSVVVLPKIVVFADRRTEALARAAGQLSGKHWMPFGISRGVPYVVRHDNIGDVVHIVARIIGRRPALPVAPWPMQGANAYAQQLTALLGDHRGARVRLRSGKTTKATRVTEEYVERHLVGDCVVTPVRTKGPWPFAVIVIARSSPAQEATFRAVLESLLSTFAGSFVFEDTVAGDVHVYVALTDGVSYGHGALVLRAYLEVFGLRWRRYVGEVVDGIQRAVLVEIAAAPAEPPPLPFAAGWRRRGSSGTQAQDILAFIDWVRHRGSADFVQAEKLVRASLGITEKWRERHRTRVRGWLLEQELKLDIGTLPKNLEVPSGWQAVGHQLSPSAAVIARAGVRSHGTFARRAALLIDELADVVDRPDVERLMVEWLSKPIVDESIATNPSTGGKKVLKAIARRYRPWRGVPVRYWNLIDERVRTHWAQLMAPGLGAGSVRLTLEALLRCAFFVSEKFYRSGMPMQVIHYASLERFTGTNSAKEARLFLTASGIISVEREYKKGVRSRTYAIAPDLWPPRASESRVFRVP